MHKHSRKQYVKKIRHWFAHDLSSRIKIAIFGGSMLLLGTALGSVLRDVLGEINKSSAADTQLRLPGQRFTSPLLACSRTLKPRSQKLDSMQSGIEHIISQAQAEQAISTASVYVRVLGSGEEFLIHPQEHYFPASLRKLPLMMQYFRESESDPAILTSKRKLESTSSANLGVIIPPKISPIANKEYSAQDLIELMIRYSDNVSFQILYEALGEQRFQKIYEAMQLEYPQDFKAFEDHRSPLDYALFFRTLYNATYLSVENSEKALELLARTDYAQGIVRHLPPQLLVAHKFGVATLEDESGKQYGELHDCGIVYKPDNPYVLCIMTKSYSTHISAVEEVIANISASVYENLDE